MKNKEISKTQKVIAYIIMGLTIAIFFLYRDYKIEKHKLNLAHIQNSIEDVCYTVVPYLYNGVPLAEDKSLPINKDYLDTLETKFHSTSQALKDANMELSHMKLNKSKIQKTRKKGVLLYVYSGTTELAWYNINNSTESDIVHKNFTAFLTNKDGVFQLANVEINDTK